MIPLDPVSRRGARWMSFILPSHWPGAFLQSGPWRCRPEPEDMWKCKSHLQDEMVFSFLLLPLFLSLE